MAGNAPGSGYAQRLRAIMDGTRTFQRTRRWCWECFWYCDHSPPRIGTIRRAESGKAPGPVDVVEDKTSQNYSGIFRVFPVVTELQHAILPSLGGSKAAAYVLINGNAVFTLSGEVDEKALHLDAIGKELTSYPDKNKSCLYIAVNYVQATPQPVGKDTRKLQRILEAWGRQSASSQYKSSAISRRLPT